MTREDIDRIASEYFNDKESEHEMDEVFDLAKKALEERKENVLDKIRTEIEAIEVNGQVDEHTMFVRTGEQVKRIALDVIDKYSKEQEE